MIYSSSGGFEGAIPVDPGLVGCFRAVAEASWRLATPFEAWWAEHPQCHRSNQRT